VLAQRPSMEQAFYTLEEDLMAPINKIHPWSPDEPRSERFEQALFAAASRVDTASQNWAPPGGIMEGDLIPQPVMPQVGPAMAPMPLGAALFAQDTLAVQAATTTHSLIAQTYQAKAEQTAELRMERLNMVKWGWVGLVIALIGAGLAASGSSHR